MVIVGVNKVTGLVEEEAEGEGITLPESTPTRDYFDVSGHAQWAGITSLAGKHRLPNGTFEAAPPSRIIRTNDFLRRFTVEEDVAFEIIGESNPMLRVLTRRLITRETIDLDHPEIIAGLVYMKQIGVPAVWATAEIADTRIAQVRGLA